MSGKSTKVALAKVRSVLAWDSSLESNPSMSAKIWVSRDTQILVTGGVEMGKRCWVERTVPADAAAAEDAEDAVPIRRQATLTSSVNKKIHPNVVMMTESFRKACGFKLGDMVTIVAHDDLDVPPAKIVEAEPLEPIQSNDEIEAMQGAAWYMMKKMTYIVPGLNFDVSVVGYTCKFVVKSIDAKIDNIARFAEGVRVRIKNASADDAESPAEVQEQRGKLVLSDADIPGMPQQVKQLNEFFRRFNAPPIHIGPGRACGIVVHGSQNSGKTHVLNKIAATNWGRVFRVADAKSSDIAKVFQEALEASPSIVLIDDLHTMVRKDKSNAESIVRKLCEQLDDLSSKSQRVGHTPPVLVVASCLSYKGDMPMQLQKSTRLGSNVMLVTPHTHGRRLMLEELCKPIDIADRDEALQWLAHNTYAYNIGDLSSLLEEAIEVCHRRVDPDNLGQVGHDDRKDLPVTLADLERARRLTRPTAMQDVHLQPPTIRWGDIGGQEELKAMLQRQINMTKNTDPRLKELMLAPPKGMILYGPPGCSKTLLAQAVATESGFSFLAIKGAELLNMYVGESERALRELFERARAVSPSIIFFDEIDSMGGNRTGAGGTRSQGSVNMLTTLLTEMDGFETLTGVFILAATNRPETLDPALLRPGRFGQHVYVGLPDQQAREAIIRINMGRLRTEALDIPELARLAEGFTGAEMQQACFKATERVLDAYLDGNKTIEESMITMDDVISAIQHTVRGVSQEMLDGYVKFGQRSGKKPAQDPKPAFALAGP